MEPSSCFLSCAGPSLMGKPPQAGSGHEPVPVQRPEPVSTCKSACSGPGCPPGTEDVASAGPVPLGMTLESEELSEI